MAKEIEKTIKLQVPAGKANPAPPIGPILGQHGVNIQEFCTQFNEKTKEEKPGTTLPVILTVYKDRSFDFVIKTPPAATLIMQAINLKKGSDKPNTQKVGKIKRSQLEEIAKIKMADLSARTIESAVKMIEGTAKQMGVDVING